MRGAVSKGRGNASLAGEILVGGQGVRSDPESEGLIRPPVEANSRHAYIAGTGPGEAASRSWDGFVADSPLEESGFEPSRSHSYGRVCRALPKGDPGTTGWGPVLTSVPLARWRSAAGALSVAVPYTARPRFRISFAPAASQLRTRHRGDGRPSAATAINFMHQRPSKELRMSRG
jgi:hypothetical protein